MLFWNNNTALVSSNAQMDTTRPETQINGTLLLEVPITSRHVGLINYEYFMVSTPIVLNCSPEINVVQEDDATRIGHTQVTYNQKSVLEARLRSNAVLRRGYDSKNIYLEVENQFAPMGIRYQQLKQFEDVFPSQLPKTVIFFIVKFLTEIEKHSEPKLALNNIFNKTIQIRNLQRGSSNRE